MATVLNNRGSQHFFCQPYEKVHFSLYFYKKDLLQKYYTSKEYTEVRAGCNVFGHLNTIIIELLTHSEDLRASLYVQ